MQIQILTVGKLKEKYLVEAVQEYQKRLTAYAKITLREVKDEKVPDYASAAEEAAVLRKEASRLEPLIRPGTCLIALAIQGKMYSSCEFARYLEKSGVNGKSDLTFLVGGSLGLAPHLIDRADLILSFSPMTFPHQLFRVLLLEQLFRAFKIIRNEPYHK